MGGLAHSTSDKTPVLKQVEQPHGKALAKHQGHSVPVTARMAAEQGVPVQRGASAVLKQLHHALLGERTGAFAKQTTASVSLHLERRQAYRAAVLGKKPRQHRHVLHIAIKHRGVKKHRHTQAASAGDVLQAQGV